MKTDKKKKGNKKPKAMAVGLVINEIQPAVNGDEPDTIMLILTEAQAKVLVSVFEALTTAIRER
jgi:hypothetical protein